MNPFVFVFLDGFGLGDPAPSNPLFTSGITVIEEIAGKKLIKGIDCEPEVLIKDRCYFRGRWVATERHRTDCCLPEKMLPKPWDSIFWLFQIKTD